MTTAREQATVEVIANQPSSVKFTVDQWNDIQKMLEQASDVWEPLLRELFEAVYDPDPQTPQEATKRAQRLAMACFRAQQALGETE